MQSNILEKANDVVQERMASYGHPAEDFSRTSKILNALNYRIYDPNDNSYRYLKSSDIAIMMVAVKLSRECNKSKYDNALDIVGYMLTYELTKEKEFIEQTPELDLRYE